MTKHDFKLHTPDTAPDAARDSLTQVKQRYGRVPNFFAVAAESPAAILAYLSLGKIFGESGLSPVEQQIVILTASVQNKCDYCVTAHSRGAKMAGVPDEVIQALRDKRPLKDDKLEALRRLTAQIVDRRGWASDDEIQSFFNNGYSRSQLLDVIVGVSMKTLSNYINHISDVPPE